MRVLCLAALVWSVASPAVAQPDSAELRRLHDADQSDRERLGDGTTTWAVVSTADSLRRARVEALLGSGRVRTGADLYHAALVLQHGGTPYDYYRAYALSRAAYEAHGYRAARWLVPRGYDRWQQSIGRPQVYGTQLVGVFPGGEDLDAQPHADPLDSDLVWSLGDVDLDAVTDAERAAWGVRSADEVRAHVACVNAPGGDFDACDAAARARGAIPPDE